MNATYNMPLSSEERTLFNKWAAYYPPTAWEQQRIERIHDLIDQP